MGNGYGRRPVDAARSGAQANQSNVQLGDETIRIYVCQGYERRNEDFRDGVELIANFPDVESRWIHWLPLTLERTASNRAGMRRQFLGPLADRPRLDMQPTPLTLGEWTYNNPRQGINYVIQRKVTKQEFKAVLEEPGAIVIYMGHARWGRGPCFGPPGGGRGENWENGSPEDQNGIFRMGFRYVATTIHDLEQHQYTPNLYLPAQPVSPRSSTRTPPSAFLLDATECEPDLRRRLPIARVAELHSLTPVLQHVPNQRVITFRARHRGVMHDWVVHNAGWRDTVAHAQGLELAQTRLQCKMLCLFGCDSLHHFRHIIRSDYGWARDPATNERHVYFNDATAIGVEIYFWMYHMMTYPHRVAHQPWHPWMQWVARRVTADVHAVGQTYNIV